MSNESKTFWKLALGDNSKLATAAKQALAEKDTEIESLRAQLAEVTNNYNTLLERVYAAPSQKAPVAQGEPVGVVVHKVLPPGPPHWSERLVEAELYDGCDLPEGTKLYTTPQQASEPMTDEQKHQSWVNATIEQCSHEGCYMRGIEDAERHHQIKGEQ
jgi:seryl-tRNA synthetase